MEAYLAADVSKGYADFVLLDPQLNDLEHPIQFDDSPAGHEALKQWLDLCITTHQLSQIFAGMESTGGFENNWFTMFFDLAKTRPVQVCRLNPRLVANAAKAEGSRQHTDVLSAYHIAYYQRRYHDKITYQQPENYYRGFRSMDNHIQLLLRQRTELINEFKQLLYRCMPELLRLCRGNGLPTWMLTLLEKYPDRRKLARAQARTLARIEQLSLEKAQKIIANARQSVADAPLETDVLMIKDQATAIRAQSRRIETFKAELVARCTGPEIELLQTIKGIGAYSAARLMIYIEDIRRFASPKHIAGFFGLHPIIKQSGDQAGRPRMSKCGHAGVRSTLFMCAQSAVVHDAHLRAIFERHRAAGKNYFQAIGVIMHKMLRIVWGVLTRKTAYDAGIDQRNQQKAHQAPTDQTHAEWRHKRRGDSFDEDAPVSSKAFRKRKAYQLSQVSDAEQVRDLTDMPDT